MKVNGSFKPSGSEPRGRHSRSRRIGLFVGGMGVATLALLCVLEDWVRAHSTRVVAARASGPFIESDPNLLVNYTPRGRRLIPGSPVRILKHRLSGRDIDMQINSLGRAPRGRRPVHTVIVCEPIQ
jgi:hypothetical protein